MVENENKNFKNIKVRPKKQEKIFPYSLAGPIKQVSFFSFVSAGCLLLETLYQRGRIKDRKLGFIWDYIKKTNIIFKSKLKFDDIKMNIFSR